MLPLKYRCKSKSYNIGDDRETYTCISAKRSQGLSPEVIQRELLEWFQREDNPQVNSRGLDAAEAIYRRGNQVRDPNPKRPANAKVTFGNAARAHLDELNLHGKARKQAKKYHKNIVKQDMKKHGADSARILYVFTF